MSEKIKFGIIGCGRIAHRHAEEIIKIGDLIAVCDIDESKGKNFAEKYMAKFYNDSKKLLETEKNINVISICTPNGLHAQQTILALKSNFHVLCEKPMAIHSCDAKNMIAAAEINCKHLFIVKQNRFNPAVAAVHNALQKKLLGTLYSFQLNCFWNRNENYYKDSWHGKREMDGGTLFTQFSHFIDVMQWFFGDVAAVECYAANLAHENVIEFEDTGVVILKMESGALGTLNYTVNSFNENMEGSFTIFAQKATIKIGGQYLNKIEYQKADDFEVNYDRKEKPPNDYSFYKGSMSNHDKVYENVIDVLENGAAISINAYEGLKTVEIIDKIYAAVKIEK